MSASAKFLGISRRLLLGWMELFDGIGYAAVLFKLELALPRLELVDGFVLNPPIELPVVL